MIAVDRQRAVRFSTAADWLGALARRKKEKIRRGGRILHGGLKGAKVVFRGGCTAFNQPFLFFLYSG